jgi:hypothetical protein
MLHYSDGTLIEDIFWVEAQALKNHWIYPAGEAWPAVQRRALQLRSALRSISYQDIETALVRYVRALHDVDLRSSFDRVWSVLEYLTDSVGNYKILISLNHQYALAHPGMLDAKPKKWRSFAIEDSWFRPNSLRSR